MIVKAHVAVLAIALLVAPAAQAQADPDTIRLLPENGLNSLGYVCLKW